MRATGADFALRVLHCPDVVGGHAPELARAERSLGMRAVSVTLAPSRYGYLADETVFAQDDGPITRKLKRLSLVWRAVRDFDVVHFNFGSSILPLASQGSSRLLTALYRSVVAMRDVWLLKRAGKAVFVTYQGDDARQGDYCRRHFETHFVHDIGDQYYSPETDAQKREAISRFAEYADGIYALNPDLLHVLPAAAKFLPYASVNPREWQGPAPSIHAAVGPLTIVHAPTDPLVKGTRYLVQAVERLKAEGLAIELLLVQNLTRGEARKLYERGDVIVDQLLAGWYGGLAVEAMALGKPVVTYIREADLRFVPKAMRDQLPVINAHPATVEQVLRSLAVAGRGLIAEIGNKGRAYVERWHDPLKVAASVVADYRAAFLRRAKRP